MVYIPVPNCLSVEMAYTAQGQVFENVINYRTDGAIDVTLLQGVTEAIFGYWQTDLLPGLSTGTELFEIKATDISSESGATYSHVPLSGNTGTTNGEMLPLNCALVVTLQTPKRGRSYRGRIYFGGFGEPECSGSTWQADAITPVTNFMNDILAFAVDTTELFMVVVSRFHDKAARVTGTADAVSTIRVNPTVASQRRRLPGRGR